MKKYIILIALITFGSSIAFAQNTVEKHVRKGIEYHDNGEFAKAIESYKEALKIEPKSTLVHYEMALSYFSLKYYKNAITHCDAVIKKKGEHLIAAYLVKGSSLDMIGKTEESIKLFKKGIKKEGEHYLFYYNIAVNYAKMNDYSEAEKYGIKGAEVNPQHGSSHLLIGMMNSEMGNKSKALIALHYFLLTEPNTARSKQAYALMQENFGRNVSIEEGEKKTITIMLSPDKEDSPFMAVDMMRGFLQAAYTLEENEGKSEEEMFVQNTESFFTILGELKEKEKAKDIWWTFYTPMLYEIGTSGHMEAYCNYISMSSNEKAATWLKENSEKFEAFKEWVERE